MAQAICKIHVLGEFLVYAKNNSLSSFDYAALLYVIADHLEPGDEPDPDGLYLSFVDYVMNYHTESFKYSVDPKRLEELCGLADNWHTRIEFCESTMH